MTDAGWKPDPHSRHELRYWDGSSWTEHVADNGEQSTDPYTQAVVPQAPERGTGLSGLMARRKAKKDGLREYKTAIRAATADGIVSPDEESRIAELGNAFGITFDSLRDSDLDLFEEFIIARINDGRPPVLPDPRMMLKAGEVAYGEFPAALMKEVTVREFRGGSSGISIPLGGGVRYRTGSVRGRSVVVGTEMVAEDSGVFTVTSLRAVFAGTKKTLEFRHDKVIGMEQYTDGLRLNVSNRQRASLLKIPRDASPSIAAALIAASAGR